MLLNYVGLDRVVVKRYFIRYISNNPLTYIGADCSFQKVYAKEYAIKSS